MVSWLIAFLIVVICTLVSATPDLKTRALDSREEDNAIGSRVANTPTLSGPDVSYGSTLTFQKQISGELRALVTYDQSVRQL